MKFQAIGAALAFILLTIAPADAGPTPITADEVRALIAKNKARGNIRLADRWERVLIAITDGAFNLFDTRWMDERLKLEARQRNGEISRDEMNSKITAL